MKSFVITGGNVMSSNLKEDFDNDSVVREIFIVSTKNLMFSVFDIVGMSFTGEEAVPKRKAVSKIVKGFRNTILDELDTKKDAVSVEDYVLSIVNKKDDFTTSFNDFTTLAYKDKNKIDSFNNLVIKSFKTFLEKFRLDCSKNVESHK